MCDQLNRKIAQFLCLNKTDEMAAYWNENDFCLSPYKGIQNKKSFYSKYTEICAQVCICILLFLSGVQAIHGKDTTTSEYKNVEAEGMAAGEGSNARAEALTSALREAVRIGVGVNVVEQSKVSNFQLDFDRVFAQSFGYVKNYKVISTKLGEDGIYRVRVKAEVAPGHPEDNELMTFKMLARNRKSPRLSIQIEENINGSLSSKTASDYYSNLAKQLGVQVVYEQDAFKSMATKRSEVLNRKTESALREVGAVSNSDYVLEGKVIANSGQPESIAGTMRRMCSVSIELRMVDPVAGKVVVSDAMEVRRFALEASLDPSVACRDAIRRALTEPADADSSGEPGMKCMRMLFCHWIAEMDLGAIYRVEIAGFNLNDADKMQNALSLKDKIGAVWIRSVDPSGISVMEVESRLETIDLAKLMCSAADHSFTLDRSDNRYLSLTRSSQEQAVIQAVPNIENKNKFIVPTVSAGSVILVALCAYLVKRRKIPTIE